MSSLRRLVTRFVPLRARAPLRTVWSSAEQSRQYLQARRIWRAYTTHYQKAQRVFRAEGNPTTPAIESIADVGVRILDPRASRNVLDLPSNYLELVDRIHGEVVKRLTWSANCRLFPASASASIPKRTEDVPDVTAGDTIAIQLLHYLNVDGLEEMCAHLVPEVEQKIYRSYATVDKVYIYRSPISRQRLQMSWLWHHDEHPREMLKIMIYLTDVYEDTAPFGYLRAADPQQAVIGSRTLVSGNRISDRIMARYVAKGCEVRRVTGPRGTMILFNDNVIHRGTLAARSHRDVLVLQIRPSCVKTRPFIDPRWTGSFQHSDVNQNPRVMEPELE